MYRLKRRWSANGVITLLTVLTGTWSAWVNDQAPNFLLGRAIRSEAVQDQSDSLIVVNIIPVQGHAEVGTVSVVQQIICRICDIVGRIAWLPSERSRIRPFITVQPDNGAFIVSCSHSDDECQPEAETQPKPSLLHVIDRESRAFQRIETRFW